MSVLVRGFRANRSRFSKTNRLSNVPTPTRCWLHTSMISRAPVSPATAPPLSATSAITMWNGVEIPVLGFGTWRIASEAPMKEALKVGYRHLDTAVAYNNEQLVGNVLAQAVKEGVIKQKSDVFITTKLHPDLYRSKESMRKSFDDSLKKLQVDVIDLYLLHAPAQGVWEAWKFLEELYDRKLVRAIGVSNFYGRFLPEFIDEARIKPMSVQNCHNPYSMDYPTINLCKSQRMAYVAYSSIGSSNNVKEMLNQATLQRVALSVKKTVPQVMLRWGLEAGVCVIPRSEQPAHILQNSQLFDFALSESDTQAIESIRQYSYTRRAGL